MSAYAPRGARPLRVAVIGAGHLGRFHAKIYAENPRAQLVGVVDSDSARAALVAGEAGTRACASVAELGELDAVSVAVPTQHHAAVALPLLERGIACLIEKPLAKSAEQADLILAAAARGRVQVATGHVERFQPGLIKVRAMNVEPRFIECHRLAPLSFRSLDVGVVHDLMIHDLDLVLDLVGSQVESHDAAGAAILTGCEDVASVRLVFANGARANVTASRASLQPMRRFRLFSSRGYVSLDFTRNYGLVVTKGPEWESGREALRTLAPSQLSELGSEWVQRRILQIEELDLAGERPLQAQLDSFLRCLQEGRECEVSGADGRRALALADRIAADIRAQGW